MSDLLLQTKLFKPALRSSLITRTHLIDRLNAGLGLGTQGFTARLTLVCAPAGFGKTTLVATWLSQLASNQAQSSGKLIAWLSLDNNDNDPIRFLAYVTAALQTAVPHLGQTTEQALQSPQPPPIETLLTLLINDINQNDQPIILVLDDYHVITTPAIHQALTFLIEHLPPQLHLLLTSRSDPPLPLSRLRAQGQVIEIRASDLRFKNEETGQFLNQVMGLSLDDDALSALEERTEGWIAGLQLAAVAMKSPLAKPGRDDQHAFIASFTGSHRFILDYLTDEVLERRPKGTRQFLLKTAVLDRFCAPLCDAVTRRKDSQTILEQLEQANLFLIPLDDQRHWYRYHHLFAEVLQARLRQDQPELLPGLHHDASEWYEKHGLIGEAIQHGLAAANMIRAASLIERERWALLGRGEINTLHTWLDELPIEIIHARPRLSLAYAWIFSLLEQAESIEPHLLDAEIALTAADTPEQAAEIDAIRGEISTLRAEIALNQSDIPGAIELCRQSLNLFPQDDTLMRGVTTYFLGHAQRRGGQMAEAEGAYVAASSLGLRADNLLLALHALANLSIVQMALGYLGKAAETSQRILQITAERGRQSWPVAGLAYQGLGRLYYEWNELDIAVSYLRLGIEFGQRGGLTGLEINCRNTLAFALQAQHDAGGADEMLQQIAAMTERHHHPVYATIAAAQEARLRLRQGSLEPAVQWAETSGLHIDDTALPYRIEVGYLTLARVSIAQGRIEAALDLLNRLQQASETNQRTGSLIEILILCAMARWTQGDSSGALAYLERALALAEPEGYIRVFVDEGASMVDLLRQVRRQGLFLDYVNSLLFAFDGENAQPEMLDLLPEALSERELEVLRLVATGASNKEIANQLFIAVTTVKKHVSNLLVKLDTPNRTQAAARGHELGLLP